MTSPFTKAPGALARLEQDVSSTLGFSVNLIEIAAALCMLLFLHVVFHARMPNNSKRRRRD